MDSEHQPRSGSDVDLLRLATTFRVGVRGGSRRPSSRSGRPGSRQRSPPSTSRCPTAASTRRQRCACWTRSGVRRRWRRPAVATSGSSSAPPTRSRWRSSWLVERVGPERGAAGDVAGGRQAARRGPRAGSSTCSDLPADTGVAFVTGATVANACVPRRGRDALLAGARLGRAGRRPVRRAGDPTSWSASRRTRTLSKSLGLVGLGRTGSPSCPPTTRAGCAPILLPTDLAPVRCSCARRPARSTPARSTRSTRSPTGWRSGRAGCTSTARSACGPSPIRAGPTSSRGLDRADSWATDAPQVAQRHLRLRHRLRAPAGRPAAHVRRRRPATCRPTRASRRCTTPRSRRSGPARSRCGRCCGRSGAPGVAELVSRRLRRGGDDRRAAARRWPDDPQRRRAQPGARPAASTDRPPRR